MRSASPTAWAAPGSSASSAIAHEDRLDLGAERPEVLDAHRRPALEDVLAVGVRGGRQDGHPRPRPTGRREQVGVDLGHDGQELTGADQGHGSGHGRESICDTAKVTSTQRWTLVAAIIGSGAVFLDGTIVNLALKRIGEELPASVVGILEGQTYIVSGYLAVLAALLILGGALSDRYGRRRVFAIGLALFAVTSALCGLAPTMEWLILFRLLQGAAGALLVPGSLALITACFAEAGARPGVRHLGRGDERPDPPRPAGRRAPGRHHRLAGRVPHQRPGPGLRPVGDPQPRSRDGRSGRDQAVRLARLARRRAGRRWPVGRAHPRPAGGLAGPAGVGLHRRRGRVPHRLPDPHGPAAEPARPAVDLPVAGVHLDQPRDVLHLRRPVRRCSATRASSCRASSATRPSGRAPSASRSGILLTTLSTRVGTVAGRTWLAAVPRRRAAARGRGDGLVHPPAGRLRAVAAGPGRPVDVDPAGRRAHRHPALGPAHRHGHVPRRGPAHEHADELDPDAPRRASARPSTTRSRGSGSRSLGRSSSSPSAPRSTRRWARCCPASTRRATRCACSSRR